MEEWREVKGYEDKYEVSNTGKVRSLNYRNTRKTRVLVPITVGKGYLMVGLCRRNKEKTKPVVATNIETGETIRFESAAEVERVLGIDHSSVPKICTGRQKTAKGYTFHYAE